jgi:hypothetical protein
MRLCCTLHGLSEGYVVAAGDVYHEYITGSLGYTDEGTDRGNALKVGLSVLRAFSPYESS